MDLVLTILRDLAAPLFTVRFRDFFLADVLTSLTGKIIDFSYVACYFAGNEQMWKNLDVGIEKCLPSHNVKLAIGLVPYWIRFW